MSDDTVDSVDETLGGFELTGSWTEIAEFGERITKGLDQLDTEDVGFDFEEAFEEWNEWRPKHYDGESEIGEKTAEQASVEEGAGEEKDVSASEDLEQSNEKLNDSYEDLSKENLEEAAESWWESVQHAGRAADTIGRKTIRTVEEAVYKHIMTSISPYYFDNQLLSANLKPKNGGEFRLEVNINPDELRNKFKEQLDFEERWHSDKEEFSDIEANKEQVEQTEGIDVGDNN